jgi:hypothetical protein
MGWWAFAIVAIKGGLCKRKNHAALESDNERQIDKTHLVELNAERFELAIHIAGIEYGRLVIRCKNNTK